MGMTRSGSVLVVDMAEEDAPRRFAESLHDSGFALLSGHGVPTSLIGEVTREWGAFFDAGVPEEFWSGENNPWGYHRPADTLMPDNVTRRDRKDFYHLGLSEPLPPGVSKAAPGLLEQAMEVAKTLLGWLDDEWPDGTLGAKPTAMSSWVSSKQSVLRLQRYLPLDEPSEPGAVRALAHADINLITLLPAPEVAGLQLQTLEGDWMDLEYHPGLMIVNIGEMLQTASDGYYPATPHRVVVRDPADSLAPRWSLPMFFHPEDDVELTPEITAGGYRTARVEEYKRKGWAVSTGGGSARQDGR